MVRNITKCTAGRPFFAVEQPYYLKHSPGNPFLGAKHDGYSPDYCGKGFTWKPINWLYRYRWNVTENRGACPLYLKNPGGKLPHWLEVTSWSKFKPHIISEEAYPHTVMTALIVSLIVWNLTRYLFFHPDLTIYNVIFFTMRKYVNVMRSDRITSMDEPVFRWIQQPPEMYCYNTQRDLIKMGVIANDPYIEYIKSIGREKELTLFPFEYRLSGKPGEGAPGHCTTYLPKMRKDDPKWTNPLKPPKHWYSGPGAHGPHHHHDDKKDGGHGGGHH